MNAAVFYLVCLMLRVPCGKHSVKKIKDHETHKNTIRYFIFVQSIPGVLQFEVSYKHDRSNNLLVPI